MALPPSAQIAVSRFGCLKVTDRFRTGQKNPGRKNHEMQSASRDLSKIESFPKLALFPFL